MALGEQTSIRELLEELCGIVAFCCSNTFSLYLEDNFYFYFDCSETYSIFIGLSLDFFLRRPFLLTLLPSPLLSPRGSLKLDFAFGIILLSLPTFLFTPFGFELRWGELGGKTSLAIIFYCLVGLELQLLSSFERWPTEQILNLNLKRETISLGLPCSRLALMHLFRYWPTLARGMYFLKMMCLDIVASDCVCF